MHNIVISEMTSEANSSHSPLFLSREHGNVQKIRRKLKKIATTIIFSQWWSGEKGNLYLRKTFFSPSLFFCEQAQRAHTSKSEGLSLLFLFPVYKASLSIFVLFFLCTSYCVRVCGATSNFNLGTLLYSSTFWVSAEKGARTPHGQTFISRVHKFSWCSWPLTCQGSEVWFKVIPLKLFYYQTFPETWRN